MLTIPEKTVISLKDSRVRIEPGMLGYERDHKGEIAANWVADSTANPDLFNGPFFMAEQAAVSDGTFEAVYRRTRFATMMHWKKNRSPLKPWHIFAVGVIVSGDNRLIAGRMAESTAAAGRIYFPAGSFDEGDVTAEAIDVDGNMRREVKEETGIDLAHAKRSEAQMHLVTAERSIALFRRHYFDANADELLAAIRDHIAGEIMSELVEVMAISRAGDMGDTTPPTFRTFGNWHFAQCDRHKV